MAVDREYRIRIQTVGDPSGAQGVAGALNEVTAATGKGTAATGEATKSTEKLEVSHRALHMIFRQVGEASKGLEVGLMALSGIMMGSLTFAIFAVGEGVRALMEHFKKQREVALEAAKMTVEFWKAAVQGKAEAIQAARDYAVAIMDIIKHTDTLKQAEEAEAAVLKAQLAARLKIIDAMRQAEIAGAQGDKAEEARINARYGKAKEAEELRAEQAEIDLKKKQAAREGSEADRLAAQTRAAEAAKEGGLPQVDREAVIKAKAEIEKLDKELPEAKSKTLTPEQLRALQALVASQRGEAEWVVNPSTGQPMQTSAGANRQRLGEAEKAEETRKT